MRVLHVTEVASGGVLSVVNAFATWQVDAGHDVHVLTPADAKVVAGTHHVWNPSRRKPHRFPSAIRDLHRLIDELEPDVVHLHSFFPGILGRLPHRHGLHRPAVVYQPHSWAFDAAPTRFGRLLVAGWERLATRWTDAFIVNCQDEFEEGLSHGVKMSAHVVGVPVDTKHFSPVADTKRMDLRRQLGAADQTVMLCVARLSKQKGQDRLVSVWRQAPVPGGLLVLLGEGDQSRLQQLAGPEWNHTIIAPGGVDDVRDWLHAADVYVAPSRWEGQAVAVGEALASGLPVVASRVNGVQEAIIDGTEPPGGVIVDQNDMSAFLMACRRRASDSDLRELEGAAARIRAERLFGVDEVMKRVSDAYRHALDNAAPNSSYLKKALR
jgi:glycosyltransferase involved in cell wall biosynthesis